jgi:hypothetical protein
MGRGQVSPSASGDARSALVRRLADAVDRDVDPDDEHSRWHVYRDAASHEELHALLRQAMVEGDDLAGPVVVEVLAHVDESEGRRWVGLLPPGEDRDLTERRLREWVLVREVAGTPRQIVDDRPGLMPWCQRRLVEVTSSSAVLRDLAEHGTIRKVRSAAREKLRGRWHGWG